MAAFTGIAAVSEQLQKQLQEALVPYLADSRGKVAICSPGEEENAAVGIFLYDIQEEEHLRSHQMTDLSETSRKKPPMYLNLYYMITAYASGDIRFRKIQEERVLGRIVQYFYDHPVFYLGDWQIVTQMERISTEDKLKLWSFPDLPYKVSLYYKVTPVPIESELVHETERVKEVRVHVQ